MDHSILNDNNRQENIFDSYKFIQHNPRIATTRKLSNIVNKQQQQQGLMPGIIQLNLHTSDNHLTLKSTSFVFFLFRLNFVF